MSQNPQTKDLVAINKNVRLLFFLDHPLVTCTTSRPGSILLNDLGYMGEPINIYIVNILMPVF